MSDPGAEQIPYTHEFTVDADYQRALTRALYWSQFRSATGWILLSMILIALGVSLVARLSIFVVVWLVFLVLSFGVRYLRVRSMVRVGFPVAKRMQSGFGATQFALSDGQNSSVIAYTTYDSIEPAGAVVWMRSTRPTRRIAYPRALFPDVEVERMRAALASAAAFTAPSA